MRMRHAASFLCRIQILFKFEWDLEGGTSCGLMNLPLSKEGVSSPPSYLPFAAKKIVANCKKEEEDTPFPSAKM